MQLLEALKEHPIELRETLLEDSSQRVQAKDSFESIRPQLEAMEVWLPDLFHQFLPNLQPSATVLSIGSGLGTELLHLRNLIPQGTLVAADKQITGISVMTEILSGAMFIPADFTKINPLMLFDVVFSKTQKIPDTIICRHPDIEANPWWPEFLTEWAVLVKEKEGITKLLITNYSHEVERLLILGALNQKGIIAQIFTYEGGAIKDNPDCPNEIFRYDNYITVYPPLP